MSHMPFIASPAPISRHPLCLELRVLIEILPRVILRFVSHLSLPGVMLASIVLRVRLKWRHLVEVFVSFVAHVLFLRCLVSSVVLYPSVKPFHSRFALIPFLPHKPCVSRCAAAESLEVAVHGAFQSRRTHPNANGGG